LVEEFYAIEKGAKKKFEIWNEDTHPPRDQIIKIGAILYS
jgi:hypothetical protein